MAHIEETYPQLSGLQDAYRLDAEGRVAVAEAYEVMRRVHGPLITSITARMLPDLQQDAATGRRIVFLGRDAHSFAAAARALDPGLFADHCSEVVLSRVVADAAVQDLEVHRGARFPEIEGFRATRKRVPPDEVPGAYRRLTAYLRAAGVPVGLPDSAVTLVDSSFKGTVQELIAAAYPQTDFEGRYAFFGAAPDDPNPHRKHGYVVHLAAEETGEGRGWPLDDLHSDPAKTFASKDPINAIEDTLNGPMDTPLRITSGGPIQRSQKEDPKYLVGFNPVLVPHRYRDPSTREAIKAAALLAVHDAAVEAAAHRTRPGWHESMQQQHERATAEIRAWTERSPQVDPLLKTVLDSMARRTDHPVVSQLQDHLAAAGVPERDAERLWRKLEDAQTRQARADLVVALAKPQVSTAAARGKSKTRRGNGAKKPGAGEQAGHLRRGDSEHEQLRKPPQR